MAATSHKAINNLLAAIDEAADECGASFRGWKKCGDAEDAYESARVVSAKKRPDDEDGPILLVGATAWHWAAEDEHDSVDVLFIDEAGQMSLADAIAVSQGARSVVLLGDPQQLAHVSQGTHPLGSGASVLEHLLGDLDTVPPDRGVFLDTTWRMHPDVCDFVSRTMYDGRLTSVAGAERQRVDSPGLSGSGLRMLAVDHLDNRGRSIEEAERDRRRTCALLLEGTWTDREGVVATADARRHPRRRALQRAGPLPAQRAARTPASAPSTSSRARRRPSSSSRWRARPARTSTAA